MSAIYVADKRRIQHLNFTEGFTASYPETWFVNNVTLTEAKKPPIGIHSDLNLATSRALVLGGLSKSMRPSIPATYLFHAFKESTGTLDTDWNSFSRNIGLAQEEVHLGNLFAVQEAKKLVDAGSASATAKSEDDKWLPLYLCSLYRLARINHDQYREDIKKKISLRLRAMGHNGKPDVDNLLLYQRHWADDETYCRVISGIDMFLVRFPAHVHREVRLGTTGSRFQDCASVEEAVYLSKMLGMEFPELATWCCQDDLAQEMLKVCQSGHEIEIGYSYAPYYMAMKLSNKSKYSVSDNPSFHLFAHIIGCTRGKQRSMNAQMAGEVPLDMILLNACVLAYASRNFGAFERLITETGEKDEVYEEEPELEEGQALLVEPSDRGSRRWVAYIRDNEGKLTPKMVKVLENAWQNMTDLRPGTVGMWLKGRIGTFSTRHPRVKNKNPEKSEEETEEEDMAPALKRSKKSSSMKIR